MKRRLFLIPFALLFFAIAPELQIVVNNATLPVTALQQHNRVLVPMRALFEALGAGVVYTPATHTIIAKTQNRRIELVINSPRADVDGASMLLDAPPRIIGTRTFVPLRFVAQTLGAYVSYDNALRIVTIKEPPASTVSTNQVTIASMLPNDGSTLATGYPTIRAEILNAPPHKQPEIALYVDNNDVTSLASFDGHIITYVPRAGLSSGRHTVTFSGDYNGSDPFIRTWSFTNSLSYEHRSNWPSLYNQFDFRMLGSTYVAAGQMMQFVLTGPQYGSAYLQPCYGNQLIPFYPSGNGYYYANLQAPWVNSYYQCPVTAIFYDQFGNATYLPYPAYFHVDRNFIAQPTPRPFTTLPPLPPPTPKPPTPYPTPTPTPATRHVLPLPIHRPIATPTPRPTVAPRRIILPVHPKPVLAPRTPAPKATIKPKVKPKPKPKATDRPNGERLR